MSKKHVPVTFRIHRQDRRELREILMRGGVSIQDFGAAVVELALGRNKGSKDPIGAVAMLRTQSPRPSFRTVARGMLGLPPEE